MSLTRRDFLKGAGLLGLNALLALQKVPLVGRTLATGIGRGSIWMLDNIGMTLFVKPNPDPPSFTWGAGGQGLSPDDPLPTIAEAVRRLPPHLQKKDCPFEIRIDPCKSKKK